MTLASFLVSGDWRKFKVTNLSLNFDILINVRLLIITVNSISTHILYRYQLLEFYGFTNSLKYFFHIAPYLFSYNLKCKPKSSPSKTFMMRNMKIRFWLLSFLSWQWTTFQRDWDIREWLPYDPICLRTAVLMLLTQTYN